MPGLLLLWDADKTIKLTGCSCLLSLHFLSAGRLQEVEGAQQESLRGAADSGGMTGPGSECERWLTEHHMVSAVHETLRSQDSQLPWLKRFIHNEVCGCKGATSAFKSGRMPIMR